MKSRLTVRNIVFALTILVLLAAVPFSLHSAYQHGGFYVFSRRFLEDLPKRLTGPGRFRFIMQPAVAILIGIRAGITDARAGRGPYLLSLILGRADRSHMLKEAFSHLATLLAMAILLDAVSQFLILRAVYPGAALIVGPVLIAAPYSISRALANRAARRKLRSGKSTAASTT